MRDAYKSSNLGTQLYPFDLTSRMRADIDAANAEPSGSGPIFRAYLAESVDDPAFDEPSVVAAGRCPICKRVHAFGLAPSSWRWAKCRGVEAPERIQVRYVEAVMPEDICREYDPKADRRDLLTFAMLARSGAPWSRLRTHVAARAIIRCEALDEPIACAIEQWGLTIKQARRDAVARLIRRQPGRTMRLRLASALVAAHDAAGRGEIGL